MVVAEEVKSSAIKYASRIIMFLAGIRLQMTHPSFNAFGQTFWTKLERKLFITILLQENFIMKCHISSRYLLHWELSQHHTNENVYLFIWSLSEVALTNSFEMTDVYLYVRSLKEYLPKMFTAVRYAPLGTSRTVHKRVTGPTSYIWKQILLHYKSVF